MDINDWKYFILTSEGKFYFNIDENDHIKVEVNNFHNTIYLLNHISYDVDCQIGEDDFFQYNFDIKRTKHGNFLLINSSISTIIKPREFLIFETNPIDYDVKNNQDKLLNSLFKL